MIRFFLFILLLQGSLFAKDITGFWVGSLDDIDLTIYFEVENRNDKLVAILGIAEQDFSGIQSDECIFDNNSIYLSFLCMKTSIEGIYHESKDQIDAVCTQFGIAHNLTLSRAEQKPEHTNFYRSQEVVPPFPYDVKEVSFTNEDALIEIKGTLTTPNTQGQKPAIVLVSGSGPADRDAGSFGHKPNMLLADRLTKMGFVVLRYDKRGVGKSEGCFTVATTEQLASDAAYAVEYLRSQDFVDEHCIGVVGHSEGGIIGPMIASEHDLSFLVLLSAPGVTGAEILLHQQKQIFASFLDEEDLESSCSLLKEYMDFLSNEGLTEVKVRQWLYDQVCDEEDFSEEAFEEFCEEFLEIFTDPWTYHFVHLDPAIYLSSVEVPVLVIHGDLDGLVPAYENVEAIRKALIQAGNKNVTIKLIPDCNHFLKKGVGMTEFESIFLDETISEEILEALCLWLEPIAIAYE
jgi:uncharacterized protein